MTACSVSSLYSPRKPLVHPLYAKEIGTGCLAVPSLLPVSLTNRFLSMEIKVLEAGMHCGEVAIHALYRISLFKNAKALWSNNITGTSSLGNDMQLVEKRGMTNASTI